MGLTNRKKPFTDVMKYTVQVRDNGYVNLPVSQTTYTPDTVIKIDWGDGSTQQLEQGVAVSKNNIHQYTTAGEYQISISTKSNKLRNLSFSGMRYVTSIDTPILNIASVSAVGMFRYTSITTFPQDIFIMNTQLTNISSCFNSTSIQIIPRGFTKYLPNLNNIRTTFSYCKIQDIQQAINFLTDVKLYNKVESVIEGVFGGSDFTTSINLEYAQTWFSLAGNLEYICYNWKINYVPWDIFNQFSTNTSLQSSLSGTELSGNLQLMQLPESTIDVSYMFSDTDITSVSGTLGNSVSRFSSMFQNCETLSQIQDDIVPSVVEIDSLERIFSYCTSLETIPITMFKNKNFASCQFGGMASHSSFPLFSRMFEGSTFSSDTWFTQMFIDCQVNIPEELFYGCVVDIESTLSFSFIFDGTDQTIPSDFFSYFNCNLNLDNVLTRATSFAPTLFNNLKISRLVDALQYCNATELPSKMFQGCEFTTDTVLFQSTFRSMDNLITVPSDLLDGFNTEGKSFNFDYCFRDCTNITSAVPELWNRTDMNIVSHIGCFRGCTNAANYDDIPDEWK